MVIGGRLVTYAWLEEVGREVATGRSMQSIAAAMGVTKNEVSKLKSEARRQGIHAPRTPYSETWLQRGHKVVASAKLDALDDTTEGAPIPRCRCGLALPCEYCLPDLARELRDGRISRKAEL